MKHVVILITASGELVHHSIPVTYPEARAIHASLVQSINRALLIDDSFTMPVILAADRQDHEGTNGDHRARA